MTLASNMVRTFLIVSLLLAASCAAFHPKKPPSKGVLCVWPDPITFTLADDNWKVCFDIDHSVSTGYQPLCTTIGEVRQLIAARRLTN
jgi:hypothetical protein